MSGGQECFAREAYDKAVELIGSRQVRLEKDVSETDRYGRLLRYVYLGNLFVNYELVLQGFAKASTYPPDVKYQDLFSEAERSARSGNRGLWSSCSAAPVYNSNNTGSFSCDCSKPCTQISSCEEAQYQLNNCGCSARDGDKDGIACDGAPLHCQN